MGSPQTIKVRGEGGTIQTLDVPPEGTHRRQHLDDFITRGWLTVVEGDYTPTSAQPATEPDDAPVADPDAAAEEPPRSGKGSGVKAWREYADTIGVEYPSDAKAADIIEAVDAARAAS